MQYVITFKHKFQVQQRMRGLHYSHPMEFADDMRRIVTETYRYCHPDDPIVTAAAKLQQEFEMLFAKINFQVRLLRQITNGCLVDDLIEVE